MMRFVLISLAVLVLGVSARAQSLVDQVQSKDVIQRVWSEMFDFRDATCGAEFQYAEQVLDEGVELNILDLFLSKPLVDVHLHVDADGDDWEQMEHAVALGVFSSPFLQSDRPSSFFEDEEAKLQSLVIHYWVISTAGFVGDLNDLRNGMRQGHLPPDDRSYQFDAKTDLSACLTPLVPDDIHPAFSDAKEKLTVFCAFELSREIVDFWWATFDERSLSQPKMVRAAEASFSRKYQESGAEGCDV